MVRYVVELGRALARRPDIELHLLVRPEAVADLGAAIGVGDDRVHPLPGRAVTASVRLRLGVGMVDVDRFDVIHGTKHLIPHRSRALRLLTVHDLLPLDRPADFGLAKRTLLPHQYLASLGDADALVCVSEATRARLVARRPELAGRATVVPLALSDALIDAVSAPIHILAGRRFALVVGDTSPRKNLRFLTQLWPAVQRRVPGLVLAVAGPAGWGVDDGLAELDQLIEGGGGVRLGHVRDTELKWAYEHAAVVLCPSRLEGFGLPALEAVTFGAPLVTSPDPALGEASGGHARVAALDDPLGWVEAVADCARVGRLPAERAAPRRWDHVAADTVAAVWGRRRG